MLKRGCPSASQMRPSPWPRCDESRSAFHPIVGRSCHPSPPQPPRMAGCQLSFLQRQNVELDAPCSVGPQKIRPWRADPHVSPPSDARPIAPEEWWCCFGRRNAGISLATFQDARPLALPHPGQPWRWLDGQRLREEVNAFAITVLLEAVKQSTEMYVHRKVFRKRLLPVCR